MIHVHVQAVRNSTEKRVYLIRAHFDTCACTVYIVRIKEGQAHVWQKKKQDSPGGVGGCACGSVEEEELCELTCRTAAAEGGGGSN